MLNSLCIKGTVAQGSRPPSFVHHINQILPPNHKQKELWYLSPGLGICSLVLVRIARFWQKKSESTFFSFFKRATRANCSQPSCVLKSENSDLLILLYSRSFKKSHGSESLLSLLKLMSDKSDRAKERIPNPGFDEFKRYLPYLITYFVQKKGWETRRRVLSVTCCLFQTWFM